MFKKWEELPEFMRCDEVKKYYNSLNKKKFQLLLKRIFDVVVSFIMIIVVSPILLIVGVWIKLDSEGPVFYRQERVTQYGRTFRIFKFRTMVANADKIGALVTSREDSRITKVGSLIRKCRLDEVPQLFNILSGDMTFVGTRPEVKKYVDAYTNEMYATLLLPAGVTSEASIKFKDEDEIISKYTEEGRTLDDVYLKEVLPIKMDYNLSDILKFNFKHDMFTLIMTLKAIILR
ncbi:MAG: sugar transferase [Erysipelotrichales bacterium]|nr:sugar transferase [Erysipelotrichales bacterium]